MPKVCDVCGKGPSMGNQITTRGKAKYLGGVGTKITGISRRQFKPNLQRVRVTMAGVNKTINACTQCIRSGSIAKTIKAAPFRLPKAPVKTPAAAGKPAAGKAAPAAKAEVKAKAKGKGEAPAKAPAKPGKK